VYKQPQMINFICFCVVVLSYSRCYLVLC
jgi:hypothetical protein